MARPGVPVRHGASVPPAEKAGMRGQAFVPRTRGSGAGGKRGRTSRAFSGVQLNNYWSSTTNANNPNNAWNVNLNNGNVNNNDKNNTNYVWPVRGGA
jgi:hypothetical protein